jgi:hypothetical protein
MQAFCSSPVLPCPYSAFHLLKFTILLCKCTATVRPDMLPLDNLCGRAQAGWKFVATRKYWNRTNTSLSFPYIWLLAGDWLLGVVKVGGVTSFLGGFRDWGLGLAVWTPLQEVLIWLASRWDSSWVLRRCPRVCWEGKTGLVLGDFKFPVLVLYLAHLFHRKGNNWSEFWAVYMSLTCWCIQ